MRKRLQGLVSGMLIGAFITGGAVYASVATKKADLYYNDIKITVDGQEITPIDANGNSTEPFIIDGTTYLPVRAMANAFGKNVDWDAETNTVVITSEEGISNLGTRLFEEFRGYAEQCGTTLEIAENLAKSSELEMLSMATMEVEPGHLIGFGNAEITGFEEGVQFSPIIGTLPFVGYVFTLPEDADVNAFTKNLEEQANLNWNVCTTADNMFVGNEDNIVFFLMSPNEITE